MTVLEIPVRNSDRPALIDPADEALVAPLRWRLCSGYARSDPFVHGQAVATYMHRLILPPGPGLEVDHINRDRFDNRRSNLRIAEKWQQNANSGLHADNTSGFRGVSHSKGGRWRAYIGVDGRTVHLGVFTSREAAALAYDHAALNHFGEFATLNFPERALERAA